MSQHPQSYRGAILRPNIACVPGSVFSLLDLSDSLRYPLNRTDILKPNDEHLSFSGFIHSVSVLHMRDCTFVLLTSPRDTEFVGDILRHLLKMCSFPFREVILVVDDLPKRTVPQGQENLDAEFSRLMGQWQQNGTVTRSVRLSTIPSHRLANKYFGSRVSQQRDFRGIPMFGWIAGLEEARTEFVVHFDSDILLHQAPDHSWIEAGMALIEKDPLVMFVSPLPGPPASDGCFHDQTVAPTFDGEGNLRFKTFSSRRFLVNKQRFEDLLPTPIVYTSAKGRRLMWFGIGNALWNWETCVSCAMKESQYYRVHLRSPKAWSIHCLDHGPAWVRSLPTLIKRVEEDDYPAEQGGHYDLIPSAWT